MITIAPGGQGWQSTPAVDCGEHIERLVRTKREPCERLGRQASIAAPVVLYHAVVASTVALSLMVQRSSCCGSLSAPRSSQTALVRNGLAVQIDQTALVFSSRRATNPAGGLASNLVSA